MKVLTAIALAILASACTPAADLGGDGDDEELNPAEFRPSDSSEAWSAELIYRTDGSSAQALAIAGGHLYFPVEGSSGSHYVTKLMRCEKTSCSATAQRVFEGADPIVTLQVFGDRIGMIESGTRDVISSCALPDCSDFFRLESLLRGTSGCQFDADAVEWSQANDEAIYRCALPECPGGPELVFAGITADEILRDEEVTILHGGSYVWRISGDSAVPELLELGAESRTLGDLGSESSDAPEPDVGAVAIDGDWLYGSLHTGCTIEPGFCSIARWPLRGYGPRELILTGERPIHGFRVHRGELAARSGRAVAPWDPSSILFCRTEACAETLHEVVAPGWSSALVSDDARWYWSWNAGDPNQTRIFSVPRLDSL